MKCTSILDRTRSLLGSIFTESLKNIQKTLGSQISQCSWEKLLGKQEGGLEVGSLRDSA